MSFKPYQLDRLSALVNSLSQISDWLANNSLVLNSDKTEAMIIAPPDIHLRTCQVIASFCSSANTRVHNRFVVFDCSLSLDTHIKSISRSVLFHLRNISKLWAIVSSSEMEKIVHGFLSSCLDYCNALFTRINKLSPSHLQAIQNDAARLLRHSAKRAEITPILFSLHWLIVDFRTLTLA